ncbi:hypothetical protein H4582DRAFT_2055102 [Lactarius indigo]|nr:hypothetical protein H4582DRAFT_2055102 [Lactarius indigo]
MDDFGPSLSRLYPETIFPSLHALQVTIFASFPVLGLVRRGASHACIEILLQGTCCPAISRLGPFPPRMFQEIFDPERFDMNRDKSAILGALFLGCGYLRILDLLNVGIALVLGHDRCLGEPSEPKVSIRRRWKACPAKLEPNASSTTAQQRTVPVLGVLINLTLPRWEVDPPLDPVGRVTYSTRWRSCSFYAVSAGLGAFRMGLHTMYLMFPAPSTTKREEQAQRNDNTRT